MHSLVFYGTDEFAVPALRALAENFHILAVVTRPDKPVGRKQILTPSAVSVAAAELGLAQFKPDKLRGHTETIEQISELHPDVQVVVSYGRIIPSELIHLPKFGTINIHPSLLPLYRGPSPIQSALCDGADHTGISIMMIDEEVDHGPILKVLPYQLSGSETYAELSPVLANLAAPLLLSSLEEYIRGEITPTPQNHELATFTKILSREDGKINWSDSAIKIYNQYRGLHPWPGLWTNTNHGRLKVLACSPQTEAGSGRVGQINTDNSVICGDNKTLHLQRVQLEGGKPCTFTDILRGHPDFKFI